MGKSPRLFAGIFARRDNENYITIDQGRTREHSSREALCCGTDASSFIDSFCAVFFVPLCTVVIVCTLALTLTSTETCNLPI